MTIESNCKNIGVKLISRSPAETARFGEKLGSLLNGGEKIYLYGELGAGKTCLAQGIIRGTGVTCDQYPRSPTFSIINRYKGRFVIHHMDLYRLNSIEDIFETGVEELMLGYGTILVEWAERLDYLKLQNKIDIRICSFKGDYREIYLCGKDISKSLFNISES